MNTRLHPSLYEGLVDLIQLHYEFHSKKIGGILIHWGQGNKVSPIEWTEKENSDEDAVNCEE